MTLPLAGITVLDFGQIYQGPYATMLMARAGADVIKIEPPQGEPLRRRITADRRPVTLPLAILNANKRAITLNLKSPRGRELLLDMAKRADVLLENFSPGTMDGLGAGYDVLKTVNPRLVYATGTGFGITGPDRDNLAMDFTIQAASGIMSLTGDPDGPPMKAGCTVVDFLGGIHLYAGVVTALLQRAQTGLGQLVEISMQEAVYFTMASSMDYHIRTGEVPPRVGNRQAALSTAPYNVFACADGYVAIHVVTEEHWRNLARAMGREGLVEDPRFRTNADRVANMDATDAVVREWTLQHPKMSVFAAARQYRIPCAPVRTVPEVMHDPHMHERGMLEEIDHPDLGSVIVPTTPLRLHGADRVKSVPSPKLGQHNREVYHGWLGLSEVEVEGLKRDGVI